MTITGDGGGEVIGGVRYEPGPWYELTAREKTLRWLRFQPAHKVRQALWWARATVAWYARWRWLPKRDPDSTWCNRIIGDADAVCPWCVWQFTLGSDAVKLERHFKLVFPSGDGVASTDELTRTS